MTTADRYTLIEVGAVAIATTVAFLLFFPHRSDYAGHYVAGLGGTLALLAGYQLLTRRGLGANALWLTLAAIALGYVTESTVFRIAIFDPVDFFVQSTGSVVAAWLLLDRDQSRALSGALIAAGVVLVGAGFIFAFA